MTRQGVNMMNASTSHESSEPMASNEAVEQNANPRAINKYTGSKI